MKKIIYAIWTAISPFIILAQPVAMYPKNGVTDERNAVFALVNIKLYLDYQTFIPNGALVFTRGKVIAAGSKIPIPKSAQMIDMKGAYVYPSFVEVYSDYGLKPVPSQPLRNESYQSAKPGAFAWNEALIPEYHASQHLEHDEKSASLWRKAGFGVVLSHRTDGIARGTAALVALGESLRENMLSEKTAAFFSFEKGHSTQAYPTSLPGAVALLRQTFLDGAWYKNAKPDWRDLSLLAWNENLLLPKFFVLTQKTDAFLVKKLSQEFAQHFILIGTGEEWRFATDIAACGMPVVVPVNFPAAFEPEEASLFALQSWYYAPANAAALLAKGCQIGFTTKGLNNKTDFLKNIRRALPDSTFKTVFLKALTYTPASWLGQSQHLGHLRAGAWANFLVCNGDIFDGNTKIIENWIQGKRYEIEPASLPKGDYTLIVPGLDTATLQISLQSRIVLKDTLIPVVPKYQAQVFELNFGYRGQFFSLSGLHRGDSLLGVSGWLAVLRSPESQAARKAEPFPGIGPEFVKPKKAFKTLIRNATVWTNEAEGILQTDVLIENGKIIKLSKNLPADGAIIVDGTGKHLTSGIIDEHSHIALQRGVNEWSHSITSEVRMADGLFSEDINIFRQLSGGVTAAQILHGSANPIGGQSALIKLRYHTTPDALLIADAPKFIKFALGENPKRSNWPQATERYPQTRMGVEQIIADGFLQAKAYNPSDRRDLRLEALAEVLSGRRFITCHSYVQSEILMLMQLGERMGFKVNTFTHVLEGYKVAQAMKAHGAAGSTFSDWWAYKYEVRDAIPYNTALMHQAGVLTAVNSDDAEMGRRLNHEAAKAIKYGGLSQQDAWKTITLNPAIMLHLDKRMGSIAPGKDADLVLWSANPLSVFAVCEKTWVDGVLEFDRSAESARLQTIESEKNRLKLLMLKAIANGAETANSPESPLYLYHCDSE